jgi:hypothetical protein
VKMSTKMKRIILSLTDEQAEWLKDYKERTGIDTSVTIRRAINNLIEWEKKQKIKAMAKAKEGLW